MPSNSADVNLFWSYLHTGNKMHMLCSEYPFFRDLCSNNMHLDTLKFPSFSSTLQKKLASIFFKHHFPGCKTPSFFTINQKQPGPLNSLTVKNQVHHVADRWDFWRQQKWKMEKSRTFPQRLLRFKHEFKGGADFYCLM